ncbi:MAG: hypothetical protein QM765_34360 [Myxococcales bacterium]
MSSRAPLMSTGEPISPPRTCGSAVTSPSSASTSTKPNRPMSSSSAP